MAVQREVIDIEALLIRAYREKRVDRYGQDGRAAGAVALGLGAGPRAPGSQLGGPERVDTSSYAANSAARTREAFLRLTGTADGLLALHDAVLALPDFYVEYGAGADFLVFTAEDAARIGHRVTLTGDRAMIQAVRRRGGRGAGRDDLLPDGEPRPCTRIVTSVLVIGHGRDMSRPDLSEVVTTRRPIYADRIATSRATTSPTSRASTSSPSSGRSTRPGGPRSASSSRPAPPAPTSRSPARTPLRPRGWRPRPHLSSGPSA